MIVRPIEHSEAVSLVVAHHYMHRKPPISFAFGLVGDCGNLKGCITLGTPASRHMLISACKTAPQDVIELNRLWCHDDMPRNTESWFISRALAQLPAKIVLSYADTSVGHFGHIYRAANFYYAGWTDMERKTPRFDYVLPDSPADLLVTSRQGRTLGMRSATMNDGLLKKSGASPR